MKKCESLVTVGRMLQIVVMVGVMVMTGLVGRAEAQCGYQPDWCKGMVLRTDPDFPGATLVRTTSHNGQVQLSNAEACFFAENVARMGNMTAGAMPVVNGVTMPRTCGNIGWSQPACATVFQEAGIEEVDGGFYIYVPTGYWTFQEFEITGGEICDDTSLKLLTVNRAANSGTVGLSPAPHEEPTETGGLYTHQTPVTITVTPATGYVFTGWEGCPNPSPAVPNHTGVNTCQVNMLRDREITASLVPNRLTINHLGLGTGTVTAAPDLNEDEFYPYNASVTITATPEDGSVFSGWVGCPNPGPRSLTGPNTCAVNMTGGREITVAFNNAGGCGFDDAFTSSSPYCGNMTFDQVVNRAENINGQTGAGQCWFIGHSPNITWNLGANNPAIRINGFQPYGVAGAAPTDADVQNRIRSGTEMVDGGFYIYFPTSVQAAITNINASPPICRPVVKFDVTLPDEIIYGDEWVDPIVLADPPDYDGTIGHIYMGKYSNSGPEVTMSYFGINEPPVYPGDYTLTITFTSPTQRGGAVVPFTINERQLTWNNDGEVNDNGTVIIPPTLNGVIEGDVVTVVVGTVTGTEVSGFDIAGDSSWKYIAPVEQPVFSTGTTNSVLSPDRSVPQINPGADNNTSVNVLSGEFTAAPNPAVKSAGVVNFFWQGKRIKSASLTIFDASGNVVNKRVSIKDKAADTQARRAVGSWNLKDAKKRQVAEGTYLVKGTVTTSDGKRERVSLMVGVR